MSKILFSHINRYVSLEEKDFSDILCFFENRTVKKKEYLLRPSEKKRYNYFVLSGCLQMYFINNKGIDQTIQFAIKNWWISDYPVSVNNSIESNFYIRAEENTEILALDFQNEHELFQKFPKMESYFRQIYQIAYGASLMRFKYMFDFSKEERYYHFIENYPDFAQQVPQYLIASYLGLTPEYVSEIRAKKRS